MITSFAQANVAIAYLQEFFEQYAEDADMFGEGQAAAYANVCLESLKALQTDFRVLRDTHEGA